MRGAAKQGYVRGAIAKSLSASAGGTGFRGRLGCAIPSRRAFPGGVPMPKAYWVTCYRSISDPQKVAAYAKLAPVATALFGCRYVARGTAAAAFEVGQKERIVISEFPSLEKAVAAYHSPGYQEALRALGDGAVRDVRIVEGLE
jgi:uncharacterized protein (DUF1330 family)